MSRMGTDGYSSAGQIQLSARVPEPLKDDFKRACESNGKTMTDVIEEKMQEYVDEHNPGEGDETDHSDRLTDQERAVYEACLRLVDDPHDWMIYQRRHASTIAQETKEMSADELPDKMMDLRRKGFAAMGPQPYDLPANSRDRWRCWRIKPRCADPDEWKYRE